MSYVLEVIQTLKELEALRPQWLELQWNPYYDIDWLLFKYARPWCNGNPYVILVKRVGCLEGIVAGEIRPIPIQFQIGYKRWNEPSLKKLVIHRYGVLGRLDEGDWAALADNLERLLIEKEMEAVLFRDFNVAQAAHTLMFQRLPPPCRYGTKIIQEHWFVENQGGLGGRKRRHRSFWKHVRNARNRISKHYNGNVEIRFYQNSAELRILLDHTEHVARRTWQRRLGGPDFTSDGVRDRFGHFASRGLLRARILYLEGGPAAFSHGLEYIGKFYWEVTGYDPQYQRLGVGTYLASSLIKEYHDRGIELIDSGVGNSEAKRLLCDRFFTAADRFLVAPIPRLMALNTLRVSFLRAHLGLKKALSKGGLYHKVRSIWRYGMRK